MGLGPASTGDEWIAAGEQAPVYPVMAVPTAEDEDARGDKVPVLSQCLASPQSLQRGRECSWKPRRAGGVGRVRAWLWLCYVPRRAQCWHIQAV